MKPAVNLYMAIPSVVYGFIGLTVVVPAVREYFGVPVGFGIFTASFILAIMILTVISISTDALLAVPKILEEGSVALGATYWQTIWHIVLPAAKPGIVTAIILAWHAPLVKRWRCRWLLAIRRAWQTRFFHRPVRRRVK